MKPLIALLFMLQLSFVLADLDGDGDIDGTDLALFTTQYGSISQYKSVNWSDIGIQDANGNDVARPLKYTIEGKTYQACPNTGKMVYQTVEACP